ncbi:MAG: serine hydrolase [Isosphaeraceae bacterium]|nr:serine hydrolase [Isosphaeraceae bacterium]
MSRHRAAQAAAGLLFVTALALWGGRAFSQKPSAGPAAGPAPSRDAVFGTLQREPIAGQLFWLDVKFTRFVFGGDDFPEFDFARPDYVRSVLGPYRLDATFYDQTLREVRSAAKPGRYGAVVRGTFDSGVTLKRYVTLFRQPDELADLDWWRWAGDRTAAHDATSIELPPELGIKPDVAKKHARNVATYVKFGFYEDLYTRPYSGRFLASLYESTPDDSSASDADDAIARDRQWWVSLKRRLEGLDGKFPGRYDGPTVADGAATVLRAGTSAEAGLGAELNDALGDVYTDLVTKTGETFTVAVARDGVLCFDKAYGAGGANAAATSRLSHVASINKVMTGVAVMMLVDRGLINLDDDITRYFPSLSDVKLARPITVRHLLTHTSGLPDLCIDEVNDLEQVLRVYMPYANVGQRFEYCETGYGLAGKIVENVTGTVFPKFLKSHVLDPLGMKDTQVRGAESDAYSTAKDLAYLGQMILNKGTYGGKRFFGPATYEKMLPQRLTSILGPDTGVVQGIGLHPLNVRSIFSKAGPTPAIAFSPNASNKELGFGNVIGHGSVSRSVFALDLDKKLVYTVASDNKGDGFRDVLNASPHSVKGLKGKNARALLGQSFEARKTTEKEVDDFQLRAVKVLGGRLSR